MIDLSTWLIIRSNGGVYVGEPVYSEVGKFFLGPAYDFQAGIMMREIRPGVVSGQHQISVAPTLLGLISLDRIQIPDGYLCVRVRDLAEGEIKAIAQQVEGAEASRKQMRAGMRTGLDLSAVLSPAH